MAQMSERDLDMREMAPDELDGIVCFTAEREDEGERIDKFISLKSDMSRAKVVKLIEGDEVLVNGKAPAKNYKIKCGDRVEITLPEPEICEALPENIPLDIIYAAFLLGNLWSALRMRASVAFGMEKSSSCLSSPSM